MEKYHIVVGGNVGVGRREFLKSAADGSLSNILLSAFQDLPEDFTVGVYNAKVPKRHID